MSTSPVAPRASRPVDGVMEVVRHGGVFAFGLMITRLTAIILLPVYTKVLTPADYGVIALLDLVQEVVKQALGTALVSSASRFHFDTDDEAERSRVWWTALLALVAVSTAILLPLVALTPVFSVVTFGDRVPNGARLFTISLSALWFGLPENLFQSHLRVLKRSRQYVALSVVRLAFNIAINLLLLYRFHLGVPGVLIGNLITSATWTAVHLVIFRSIRGPVAVNTRVLKPMMHFGMPMVAVALLSMAMHHLDRAILVRFVSLDGIGIYSLAYQIGQGVNSLVLSPFSQIWGVMIFELGRQENASAVFSRAFSAFVRLLLSVLLAASLGAGIVVRLLAPPPYWAAADLAPIIALGYLFFSFDDHFRVPALLRKRTVALVPVYVAATTINLCLNLALVPRWGIVGAAWATVGTFLGFSAIGLYQYRQIEKIPYRFLESAGLILAAIAAYVGYRSLGLPVGSMRGFAIGALVWLATSAVLLRQPYAAWRERSSIGVSR